ncbi:MAG TPA: hypothetical protein VLG50_07875 [Candidatus Saccharimonadales bacterium]|nr:hypothetical protein [Candidatus Saccharimonadales bacterium]
MADKVKDEFYQYNEMNDDEKDRYFMNSIHKHYYELSEENKITFSNLARYVKIYKETDDVNVKNYLWQRYDRLAQFHCDPIKYEEFYNKKV